jgi:hypothetical protein
MPRLTPIVRSLPVAKAQDDRTFKPDHPYGAQSKSIWPWWPCSDGILTLHCVCSARKRGDDEHKMHMMMCGSCGEQCTSEVEQEWQSRMKNALEFRDREAFPAMQWYAVLPSSMVQSNKTLAFFVTKSSICSQSGDPLPRSVGSRLGLAPYFERFPLSALQNECDESFISPKPDCMSLTCFSNRQGPPRTSDRDVTALSIGLCALGFVEA